MTCSFLKPFSMTLPALAVYIRLVVCSFCWLLQAARSVIIYCIYFVILMYILFIIAIIRNWYFVAFMYYVKNYFRLLLFFCLIYWFHRFITCSLKSQYPEFSSSWTGHYLSPPNWLSLVVESLVLHLNLTILAANV